MSYSEAYHLDLEQPTVAYISDCCVSTEFGRVRSVAFIRKEYLQQVLADPTDVTVWQTGIDNGDIQIIMFTTGSFDAGEPQRLKGFGRRLSTHGRRDMVLSVSVPFKANNYQFFDDLDKRLDYVPAFRTENYVHICDQPADIVTKEIVEDDVESEITWSFDCTVRSRKLPVIASLSTLAALFTCSSNGGNFPAGDCSDQIYSDWWIAADGATELTGVSTQWGYSIGDMTKLVGVRRENNPIYIVLTGTPGNAECKLDASNNRVLFDADAPFVAGERVFLLFKKAI